MAFPPALADIPESFSEGEFWDYFGRIEREQLEFKRGVPADTVEAIAAMSMTDGGLIVLGIQDHDRTIAGAPLSQNTLDRVMQAAHSCNVEIQLREINVGSKRLTVVAVPEIRGRIVTTPNGRLLRRVGSECQPLLGDAMARFVREREERREFERRYISRCLEHTQGNVTKAAEILGM